MTRDEILARFRERASVPLGVVGGRPVYPIMGGADDGEDEDKDGDDEDGDEASADEADKDEDDDDEQDPAKLREDRKKLRESLKAERLKGREQFRMRIEAEKKVKAKADAEGGETAKNIEDARTAAREPLIRKLLTASARSAFLTAGFQGEVSERFIKLIDRDSLDIDDDGEIDGLDEQVAQIKRDFPEKFKRKRTGPADTGKADRDSAPKAKSASERQAEALMRK